MVMRKKIQRTLWIVGILLLITIVHLSSFVISYGKIWRDHNPLVLMDVSRLQKATVMKVERATKKEQLQAIVKEANEKGWKLSIAGSMHTQGGHTFYDNAVVLSMKDFDDVLELDTAAKTIRVEAGATWNEVQEYINPHRLAVKVMQSSNIFTVGGTMSSNAHGRDLDATSFVETVDSFRLLKPNGVIVNVSRTENPDLFRLVIGGYGMFGVILDATIRLTDDVILERDSRVMDYKEFPDYFEKKIQAQSGVALMLVRPSIHTGDAFLREMTVTTWKTSDIAEPANIRDLGVESHVIRDKFFFGLSRSYDWAKDLRWYLQKKIELSPAKRNFISRNNAMRPPETPLEFLDYYSTRNTDILQEYYVPVRNFIPFMDSFRNILQTEKMNVLSSTIRYVKANDETDLSYCPREDCFAVILMSNVSLSKEGQAHAEKVTQQLVDAALRQDGTYYVAYQLYPTHEQMHRAYPRAKKVFDRKRFYDPEERFMNKFYEKYGKISE